MFNIFKNKINNDSREEVTTSSLESLNKEKVNLSRENECLKEEISLYENKDSFDTGTITTTTFTNKNAISSKEYNILITRYQNNNRKIRDIDNKIRIILSKVNK